MPQPASPSSRSAPQRHMRSLTAAIVAMGMVNLTMGITFPLTAIILARQGVGTGMIGLSAAAQAAPVFLIAPLAPWIMRKFGPANAMFGGLLVAALAFALMGLYPNLMAWFPLRFLLGCAGTLLWATSEAWINALAPEERRGRILGIYGAAAAAGFAFGPTALVVLGTDVTPFYGGAILLAVAALIVSQADHSKHYFQKHERVTGMWQLLLIAPAALLVNFFFAAGEESLVTFFPLYATERGIDESMSLFLLTIASLGAIVLQLVIGTIADHMNRLLLLTMLVIATSAGYLALPFIMPGVIATGLSLFIVVGLAHGIFTLGMILVGEKFQGAALATASAFTTVMWGTGALVGAPLSGLAMELWNPHGLIAAIILIFVAYLPFPLIAYLRERKKLADL